MKKIIVLMMFCCLLFVTKGYGQQQAYMSVKYAVSFASGDMGDFISAASWRGTVVEYRAPAKGNLMVGVDVGWNVFYEKKNKDTYTVGNETLTGVQYRYQNEVPILVSADYLFSSDQPLKPYVGLGIGTMYSERATDMNLYRLSESTWHFAVKGELGLLYEVSYSSSIKFAAKYYNGFKTSKLDNQGYFSLSLGMAFEL